MKLAAMLNSRYSEIESRKRILRQKSADEAYRKNAQYFKPKSNPALEDLMDLLTGKKEKSDVPALQQRIRTLQNEQISQPQVEPAFIKENVEPLNDIQLATVLNGDAQDRVEEIMQRVHEAALAVEKPTSQDLKIAEMTEQYVTKPVTSIENPFNSVESDEKKNILEKPIQASTIQAQRLYQKAAKSYSYQVEMAKNGFNMNMPSIYHVA